MPITRDQIPARSVLCARKRMNDAVRGYFDAEGLLEVDTPIAVASPGMEPHLFAFETTEVGPDQVRSQLYLHTSPEYAMKRMLGRGLGSIYQLARVFRNGERSRTHIPEFTMLEWYRAPGTLTAIMDDVEAMVLAVADAVDGPWRPKGFERVSVSQAFLRAGLVDPIAYPEPADFGAAMTAAGLRTAADDTWDDIFFRGMLERVEATFSADVPAILYGYPARMAALARIDAEDPRLAERFEVFAGPLELGNAFGELSDPIEQRRRFTAEQQLRKDAGLPVYPIDEGLLADLPNMGACAGIAIGLDRLLMCCLGVDDIADVVSFAPRGE